jgi:hypothetical protein
MKRTGRLPRRTPLRPVSARRLSERASRQAVIDQVIARDGPGCYVLKVLERRRNVAYDYGWPLNCQHPPGRQLDAHEIIQRSVRPGGHLEVANVRMVCRRHHDWIDAHQQTAKTLGLLAMSWDPLPPPIDLSGG